MVPTELHKKISNHTALDIKTNINYSDRMKI